MVDRAAQWGPEEGGSTDRSSQVMEAKEESSSEHSGLIANRLKRRLRQQRGGSSNFRSFEEGRDSTSSSEPRKRCRKRLRSSDCARIVKELREAKSKQDVLPLPLPPPPAVTGGSAGRTARQNRKWEVYQWVYGIVRILNADWNVAQPPYEMQGAQ